MDNRLFFGLVMFIILLTPVSALQFPILSISDSNIFSDKTWWIMDNATDPYLYDSGGYLRFNNTQISWGATNRTSAGGDYLYNDTNSMYVNETALNATIDDRASGVTYTAGAYLYLSTNQFNVNETTLNATIDDRDTDTTYDYSDWQLLNRSGYNNLDNFTNGPGYVTNDTANFTVDTDTHLSGAEVDALVGNWTGDSSTYQIWTSTKAYIDSIGNWTSDKSGYQIWTSTKTYIDSIGNWTAVASTYQIWTTTKTYIDSIGNWTADKGDYYNKTEVLALNSTWNYTTNTDTTYTASGTLLDLTGTGFSVNEGTLTDERICEYESTGTQIECTKALDASGQCTGDICGGGHTHPASEVTTGTFGAGAYTMADNLTIERILLETDSANHQIRDNNTCTIITGDTATLSIC